MNYLYLLDTNILSELIKNPRGVIFSKIQEVGEYPDPRLLLFIVSTNYKLMSEVGALITLPELLRLKTG